MENHYGYQGNNFERIVMNEDINYKLAVDRANVLFEERKKLLNLSAEKIIDYILDYKHPAALVHSFPEEDFYFLINDIGLFDSLPLLELASNKQWQFIIDYDCWSKDRINFPDTIKWLYLLLKADNKRLIKQFVNEEPDFFKLFLYYNIDVYSLNENDDPSDLDDNAVTFDGVYYFVITDKRFDNDLEREILDYKEEFIYEFLKAYANYDHVDYINLLTETGTIIPSDVEEELYRTKNVRIAEKGFFPFEEAVGIYQGLSYDQLKKKKNKNRLIFDYLSFQTPFFHKYINNDFNQFSMSLQTINENKLLNQINHEFVYILNRLISADLKPVKNKEDLEKIVHKTCGFLNIGLSVINENEYKNIKDKNSIKTSNIFIKYSLEDIFKTGYYKVMELKWKAQKWLNNSWFMDNDLPIVFWQELWTGVLGGLLIKRPLFFDNYKTGVIYREFSSVEDIIYSNKILDDIIAMDDIFYLLPFDIKIEKNIRNNISYKNMLLTLWARNELKLSFKIEPITFKEFKIFFQCLWDNSKESRTISRKAKLSFINWLSQMVALSQNQLLRRADDIFEQIFDEIEDEYSLVSLENLDPRFINYFLIS